MHSILQGTLTVVAAETFVEVAEYIILTHSVLERKGTGYGGGRSLKCFCSKSCERLFWWRNLLHLPAPASWRVVLAHQVGPCVLILNLSTVSRGYVWMFPLLVLFLTLTFTVLIWVGTVKWSGNSSSPSDWILSLALLLLFRSNLKSSMCSLLIGSCVRE